MAGSAQSCAAGAGTALRGVLRASPMSLKQRLPLELGRHHQDSEAGRATVGSRVLHFHVQCLHAPLQLLSEVLGAEFHGGSPAGATAQRGQNPSSDSAHTTTTLTGTTSGEASTSALTKASVNPALPPSHKPRFPIVLGFRATVSQPIRICIRTESARAEANRCPPAAQQPGFWGPGWKP